MDPAELAAALSRDATVHQARGVLAALLDVSLEDATVSLELRARFSGSSVEDAARDVLADHARRIAATRRHEVIDDRAQALLRHHLLRDAAASGDREN